MQLSAKELFYQVQENWDYAGKGPKDKRTEGYYKGKESNSCQGVKSTKTKNKGVKAKQWWANRMALRNTEDWILGGKKREEERPWVSEHPEARSSSDPAPPPPPPPPPPPTIQLHAEPQQLDLTNALLNNPLVQMLMMGMVVASGQRGVVMPGGPGVLRMPVVPVMQNMIGMHGGGALGGGPPEAAAGGGPHIELVPAAPGGGDAEQAAAEAAAEAVAEPGGAAMPKATAAGKAKAKAAAKPKATAAGKAKAKAAAKPKAKVAMKTVAMKTVGKKK